MQICWLSFLATHKRFGPALSGVNMQTASSLPPRLTHLSPLLLQARSQATDVAPLLTLVAFKKHLVFIQRVGRRPPFLFPYELFAPFSTSNGWLASPSESRPVHLHGSHLHREKAAILPANLAAALALICLSLPADLPPTHCASLFLECES